VSAQRIVITRPGGPEVLSLEKFEPSLPAAGEVVIDVAAVGVNFADVFCRLGLYSAAPPIPFTPGFEVAGVVTAVGEGVGGGHSEVAPPRIGDRVMALTRFGGYVSRLNVPAEWTRPLPTGWSYEQGAAFPVVFLTAWHGLVNVGRLARGETVVVQSAAGGVGTAACQIARAFGARVIGTVGSEGKRQVALDAGADDVVVSRKYRVWREIDRLTGKAGVDLVLDAVGGRGLRHGYEQLNRGGRLVVYGFAEMMPRRGTRNWPLLLWRFLRMPRFGPFNMTSANRTVAGFNLVYLWKKPELFALALDALSEMITKGAIRPVVGATFPFDRVGEAHESLQSRKSTGKVVLCVP
jgi:NADPH:quinone reductase-like Zn-dependent oxidoreductase